VEPGQVGCVIANELLDNLPFHRIRGTAAGPAELYVASGADGFELVEGPLSSPSLGELAPDLRPGDDWVVSPGALGFVDHARATLARGYVLIVDYALGSPGQPVSVHGYRGHGLERDVLADPGSMDITAGVDLAAVLRHARASGLTTWGPTSQRDALLALGFRDLEHDAQARQREAIAARRGIDAMRIYSNRTRANLLLARDGLGDFAVVCLGVGIDLRPAAFRGGEP
jgi:SAM-dependent MidA family methyltransferase